MCTTFEGAVRRRIAEYQQQIFELEQRMGRSGGQEAAEQLQSELGAIRQAQTAYILETVPYVREYFMEQQQQQLPSPQPPADCSDDTGDSAARPQSRAAANSSNQAAWFREEGHVQRRGAVFKRYMSEVEHRPGFADTQAQPRLYDVCTDCVGEPALVLDREDQVCPVCGRCFPITNVTYRNLSFEQQVCNIIPIASYRRSNHFSEWLSKLQAREMTRIPGEVVTAVRVELKKQRLVECANIGQAKIREILKKLKLSKYYEHVPSIHSIITKTSAPKFTPVLEEKLKQLFDEIQVPFEKFKGTKRSNMLSYGFLLYKFCELLGEDDYLPYLPLLKSSTKLYECDLVWKKICADRQWEFVPTV